MFGAAAGELANANELNEPTAAATSKVFRISTFPLNLPVEAVHRHTRRKT
ncbi:hypothetical protein BURMUCGD2M_6416 [Burkholderia multivorans CGD2M]|nr:hypothetical protein BURMUCGD2M_6416 [Burkholderia multivorans CGD2M]